MKDKDMEIEKMSFEEAFAALEDIVNQLESSTATLADSVAYYELGQRLSRHCSQLLAEADLKIETLQNGTKNSAAGSEA